MRFLTVTTRLTRWQLVFAARAGDGVERLIFTVLTARHLQPAFLREIRVEEDETAAGTFCIEDHSGTSLLQVIKQHLGQDQHCLQRLRYGAKLWQPGHLKIFLLAGTAGMTSSLLIS